MPTPSMSAVLGRVRRSADSQTRLVPLGSWYVILGRGQLGGAVRVTLAAHSTPGQRGGALASYLTRLIHLASSSGYRQVLAIRCRWGAVERRGEAY